MSTGGFTPRLEKHISIWCGLPLWRYGPLEIRKRVLGGYWIIEHDENGHLVQRRRKTFGEAVVLVEAMYLEDRETALEIERAISEGITDHHLMPCSKCGCQIVDWGYKGRSARGDPIHRVFCSCGNFETAYTMTALKYKWNRKQRDHHVVAPEY